MLLLIHNIHSGLNLNNLNILEQYDSFSIMKENEDVAIVDFSIDTQNLKGISSLYFDSNIPFSF